MKRLVILMLAVLALSACGLTGGNDIDRWQAVKDIRHDEEVTKQEFLKAKQVELLQDEGSRRNPTLKVTTQDSAGRPVIIEMDLEPTISAAVGKKDGNTYGVDMTSTQLPEGAVAETIKAVGSAGKDILTTPAAMVGVTGAVISSALSETGGGGTHVTGETINTHDSFNRSEVHATGEGNTAGATARQDNTPMEEMEGIEEEGAEDE